MSSADWIDLYLMGVDTLEESISGMTTEQLHAQPVPGKWSCHQVICHIADFEPVYADRMKRVIAEDEPTFFGGDPDVFAARLAYEQRDLADEFRLIRAVRQHLATILKTLQEEDFQRVGNHSVDGPLSLEVLLKRITGHIPHHIQFIQEKRQALGL